jgi:hypothetical protein
MIHNIHSTDAALFRRARTRTLIQLGGLLEKSGLTHHMNIQIGADLQKDPQQHTAVLKLIGALSMLKDILNQEDIPQTLLLQKGKQILKK